MKRTNRIVENFDGFNRRRLNENSNILKIGDLVVDYNDTESKIVDIIKGEDIFKKYPEIEIDDSEINSNDLYYITKIQIAAEGFEAGDLTFYPVEYDYDTYWGVEKL